MFKKSLPIILVLISSCYDRPVINTNYNFNEIKSINLSSIKDYKDLTGSGEMVQSSLDYNFLKYGFEVIDSNKNKFILINKNSKNMLTLSCIITEYTESESIVLPYRTEDRGYTKTIINQTSEDNEENENFEKLETSTTTHAGTLSQGSRIVYSQSRISLILSLTDNKSGRIVWSKSTWYSGLELQRTINMCLKDGVNELRKIIR